MPGPGRPTETTPSTLRAVSLSPPSIRFGLGGLLFLYVLQPLFHRLVHSLSPRVRRGACIAVLVLLAVDCSVLLFR